MSYAAYEMSREDGQPVSLFLFEWGDVGTTYFAYTDSDAPVSYDGKTYAPTVIGREKVESSGSLDRKVLQIDCTPNASIVTLYQSPPSQKVGLTIRQGHRDDGAAEFPVVWTGVVKNVNRERMLARIIAEPLDTLLARPGLRRHYMLGCPHALYGPHCMADPEPLKRSATAATVGSNSFTLADGWEGAIDSAKYRRGLVEWTDADGNLQTRTLIAFGADDNELVVGRTTGLTVGAAVSIYAGCNRKLSDCTDLHDNVVNFGGQPFIPTENPVSSVNRYY